MDADFELLARWREGDEQAGQVLFEKHFDAISRFFRNKVDHGVDDLIQNTFLACVEARDKFEGRSAFRTYAFGIARNVLNNHIRTLGRHAKRRPVAGTTALIDPAPGASTVAMERSDKRVILEALRALSLDHQILLELYYWEDLRAVDIAEILGSPEGTVRTRIRRAKQLLSEHIEELSNDPRQLDRTLSNLDDWARSLREQFDANHASRSA